MLKRKSRQSRNIGDQERDIKKLWTPDKVEILEQPKNCSTMRFACHGRIDITALRKSCLIVGNNGKDKFTIADFNKVEWLTAYSTLLTWK